jgi:hypothetical protein
MRERYPFKDNRAGTRAGAVLRRRLRSSAREVGETEVLHQLDQLGGHLALARAFAVRASRLGMTSSVSAQIRRDIVCAAASPEITARQQ